MTLILTVEIHVLQKRAYLTYSAIKVVYTAFTVFILDYIYNVTSCIDCILCLYLYFNCIIVCYGL